MAKTPRPAALADDAAVAARLGRALGEAAGAVGRQVGRLAGSDQLGEQVADDGAMWPTTYALKDLTAAEEARIEALVKKAAVPGMTKAERG